MVKVKNEVGKVEKAKPKPSRKVKIIQSYEYEIEVDRLLYYNDNGVTVPFYGDTSEDFVKYIEQAVANETYSSTIEGYLADKDFPWVLDHTVEFDMELI